MAALLAADGLAPVRPRVAAACVLHRWRYRLPRWQPDDAAVRDAYARRRAEARRAAALYPDA